ncbi:hypothetical protein [Burkholderia vietnamiensis]|uniref:hypothetical protein n=1 Tax=Burkholderia vietnamiensis TaxID=60552 RepID=UPI001CF42EBE|nr:hypothetical protein [Burkholderia vietnamiensis]MCA8228358.1 hypothetical protein [Burkholderia vietnamiensis]
MIGDKEDDDKFVAVMCCFLLAGLVLLVGGGFTALMYQQMPDRTIKTEPQSSGSLVSLVADGQRHQAKTGKLVVCDRVETPPECRTDLLER